MICLTCATENRGDRRFCRNCGVALAAGCPACGATNEPEDRFCGTCGTALQGPAALRRAPLRILAVTQPLLPAVPARQGPVAERRLVTVLFADLVAFTTFAEGRDPEETRDLLSRRGRPTPLHSVPPRHRAVDQ